MLSVRQRTDSTVSAVIESPYGVSPKDCSLAHTVLPILEARSNGVPRNTPAGTPPSFDGSKVTLAGDGGYIDLPNHMLAGLTNVTVGAS